MFQDVNEIAVLVSAILAIAIASIWYSPLFFGNLWMRVSGLTSSELLLMSRTRVITSLLYATIANLFLFFVVAQCIALSRMYAFSEWKLGFFVLLGIGASLANMVIWEKKSIAYLFIHLGYVTIVLFGGMSVISMWPW